MSTIFSKNDNICKREKNSISFFLAIIPIGSAVIFILEVVIGANRLPRDVQV